MGNWQNSLRNLVVDDVSAASSPEVYPITDVIDTADGSVILATIASSRYHLPLLSMIFGLCYNIKPPLSIARSAEMACEGDRYLSV